MAGRTTGNPGPKAPAPAKAAPVKAPAAPAPRSTGGGANMPKVKVDPVLAAKGAPKAGPKGAAVTANAVAKNVTPYQKPTQSKLATSASKKASERRADQREAATQRKVADQLKNSNTKKVVTKTPTKLPPKKNTKPPVTPPPAAQNEVSAEPDTAYGDTPTPAATPVKTAPIDTVVFIDDAVSDALITDLLFEDVGGQELLTIARSDTVNGQEVIYQPFKNLNILQETYNPTNLLLLQETSDKIFANYIIDLREKIPKVGNGIDGKNFYVDSITGDLIVEFVNLKSDEQVEVQISTAGIIDEVGI